MGGPRRRLRPRLARGPVAACLAAAVVATAATLIGLRATAWAPGHHGGSTAVSRTQRSTGAVAAPCTPSSAAPAVTPSSSAPAVTPAMSQPAAGCGATPIPTPAPTPVATAAATPAPTPAPTPAAATSPRFVKAITLFGASDYAAMKAAGFNAATGSQYDASGGLGGMSDLVWLGSYDNSSCSWEFSDGTVAGIVDGLIGNHQVIAYQMGDEPDAKKCPGAPAQYAARTALVHQHNASARTFVINDWYNDSSQTPSAPTPFKGTVDFLAFDVYPCFVWEPASCDDGMIDRAVAAIHATGITDFWPVIQDFSGDVSWRMPTPAEITEQFDHWRGSGMSGYMVFAWDYLGVNVEAQAGNVAALTSNAARF